MTELIDAVYGDQPDGGALSAESCINVAIHRIKTTLNFEVVSERVYSLPDRLAAVRAASFDTGYNYSGRINEADVLTIRADARSYPEIAKDYDVSPSHIGRIKRRQSWRHVG